MVPMNQSLPPAPVTRPAPETRPYRVSVFWPIVLIGIGVVLLLSNMNYLQGSVWDWLWRLWPVMLIAAGLDSLFQGEFVGAALLLGFGGLFLASTFGYYSVNPLEIILRFWPLFLVSAGLGLIFSRRRAGLVGSLVGALVLIAVLALAVWQLNGRAVVTEALPGPHITQSAAGASKANITIQPSAGSLRIKALSDTGALLDGVIHLPNDESVKRSFSVQDGVANLTLKTDNIFVGVGPMGTDWHTWDLAINPNIPTNLHVDEGAGDATLDLSELKVSDLTMNMAVGASTITLPQSGDLNARLNSAIGSTTLLVPPETGVLIHMSSALVGVDVPAGYVHTGNQYQSPNYESAANKVQISVSVAIGSLTVRAQTGR